MRFLLHGDFEVVEFMMQLGIDVNETELDIQGRNPMGLTCVIATVVWSYSFTVADVSNTMATSDTPSWRRCQTQ